MSRYCIICTKESIRPGTVVFSLLQIFSFDFSRIQETTRKNQNAIPIVRLWLASMHVTLIWIVFRYSLSDISSGETYTDQQLHSNQGEYAWFCFALISLLCAYEQRLNNACCQTWNFYGILRIVEIRNPLFAFYDRSYSIPNTSSCTTILSLTAGCVVCFDFYFIHAILWKFQCVFELSRFPSWMQSG